MACEGPYVRTGEGGREDLGRWPGVQGACDVGVSDRNGAGREDEGGRSVIEK